MKEESSPIYTLLQVIPLLQCHENRVIRLTEAEFFLYTQKTITEAKTFDFSNTIIDPSFQYTRSFKLKNWNVQPALYLQQYSLRKNRTLCFNSMISLQMHTLPLNSSYNPDLHSDMWYWNILLHRYRLYTLLHCYGVRTISLFGSITFKSSRRQSDVDVAIQTHTRPSTVRLYIKLFLKLLGRDSFSFFSRKGVSRQGGKVDVGILYTNNTKLNSYYTHDIFAFHHNLQKKQISFSYNPDVSNTFQMVYMTSYQPFSIIQSISRYVVYTISFCLFYLMRLCEPIYTLLFVARIHKSNHVYSPADTISFVPRYFDPSQAHIVTPTSNS